MNKPTLDYSATSFTQGRMDFSWEELSEEERRQAYADYEAGRGLIGGDPRFRPGALTLPGWGLNLPFFRTLALDDPNGNNGQRLRADLASDRPLEIEIGYGRGDFLLDRAKRYPGRLFIGYEVQPGATRRMLNRVTGMERKEEGEKGRQWDSATVRQPPNLSISPSPHPAISNLWLSDDDCRFSIPRIIPDRRVEVVHILFPDPWWKEQHKVKRLFSPPFVDLLATKIKAGGLLHFKSDVQEYGELVRYLVEGNSAFSAHDPTLAERIGEIAMTHREDWCMKQGKPVWGYYFLRN